MLFAIGDVHGCADELRLLLNKLPLASDTRLVFLGDYVDRGPRSREVIDTVLELTDRCQVIALLGNHEAMFLDYLADPTSAKAGAFIFNGGSATLESYADGAGQIVIPPAHVAFLRSLAVCHESEHAFFVHAGVPAIPLAQLDLERDRTKMLWTRGRFLRSTYDWGKVIVHGHTPVDRVTRLPNRINIDTGCVFNRRLTALALPGEQRISVRRTSLARHVVLRDPSGRRAAFRFAGAVPVEVHRGDRVLHYVTVDYSELGMYLRAIDASGAALAEGDAIEGVVGPDRRSLVGFTGVIVRRRVDDLGTHFGVKLLTTAPAAIVAEDTAPPAIAAP